MCTYIVYCIKVQVHVYVYSILYKVQVHVYVYSILYKVQVHVYVCMYTSNGYILIVAGYIYLHTMLLQAIIKTVD